MHMRTILLAGLGAGVLTIVTTAPPSAAPVEKIDVKKIWDKGGHNAFTDLLRHRDRWFCSFREGEGHASGPGTIRVLTSADGEQWESAALLAEKDVDLRDPKLSVMPDGRLMMVGAGAVPATRNPLADHYSFVCFSKDGKEWTRPQRVLDSWQWLWRVTWRNERAYGVAYSWDPKVPDKARKASLYRSTDGLKYEKLADFALQNPSEATVAFDGDVMYCLQRRDGTPNTAQLGTSKPPYSDWTWKDLGSYFGGPNFIRLPDGSWIAVGRLIENKKARTEICTLDVKEGTLKPLHTLPSGGDNSYAGLALFNKQLWISYYSSHEGKTSIYLARMPVGKE